MADRLLTTKEVAHLLAVTTTWLAQAAASGEIPAYRIASGWRFDVDELGLWLTLQGNAAADASISPRRSVLPPPIPGRSNPPPEPIVDLERTTSAADVAGELGVPVEAVRRWVSEGILPGVRAGRSWLVDTVAFEEWKVMLADRGHGHGPLRGDVRAIRERILGELLRRMGIRQTSGSWQRHGGKLPTWAEAVIDPRRHG
ncbi:helix-turn-helix domain-containing protein [Cellulomonas hominis]|uniref:helix-turn-helix domain-containing protein n=1 Tax=Cellulomonas hominis TaxID=156981 RepID=UPI001443E35A|nr:helix-turn-helix domain-containing protein [Cellulomonas hominis]NKY08970.1 helix-turn-helix domain-containing protein [Cellulomonas hominis]